MRLCKILFERLYLLLAQTQRHFLLLSETCKSFDTVVRHWDVWMVWHCGTDVTLAFAVLCARQAVYPSMLREIKFFLRIAKRPDPRRYVALQQCRGTSGRSDAL